MKRKRFAMLGLAAALAISLLAGCGAGASSGSGTKEKQETKRAAEKAPKKKKDSANEPSGNFTFRVLGKTYDMTRMTLQDIKDLTDEYHVELPGYTRDATLKPFVSRFFDPLRIKGNDGYYIDLSGQYWNLTEEEIPILEARVTKLTLGAEEIFGIPAKSFQSGPMDVDPLLRQLCDYGWMITRDEIREHTKEILMPGLLVEGVSKLNYRKNTKEYIAAESLYWRERGSTERAEQMEAEDFPGTWSRSITAEILTEDVGLCELFIRVEDWGLPTLSFEMKDVQTYAEKDYWPAHNDLSPSVPGTDNSKLDVTWEDSNKEDVEALTELKNTLSKDRYKRNSKENELYNPDKLQSSADPDYLKKQLLKTYDESKADPMPGEYSDLIEVLSGYYPIDPARPGGVMDGFIYLQKAGSPYAFGIMSQKDVDGIYDLKQIPSDFENCSRRFGTPEHLQKGVWRWRIQDTHYSVLNVYNLANPDLTRKPGGKDKTGIITILIREEDEAETSTNVPVSTTAADNAVQTSDSRWQQEPDGRWRFFPWNNEAPDFYAVNGWYQDNDGKHYYFDRDGYMLQDTVTPDGYTVGVDGALIENVPQVTKKVNYPKMTISLAYQEEEYLQEYAAAFAKEVHDRTDGSITIENIGNADGLSEDDMIIDYTRNFACMMLADPGRLRVEYPHVLWDYLRIPFFFNDSAEAEVYLEAVTPQVFSNNFYQEHGVKILAHCLNGLSHFVSTVPLRTPEDLTGLKLRTQGSEIDFEFYSGLGAEPGFLALPDLYSAAENGQFDAADLSLETYSDFQLYKVWPYVSMTGNRMQTFSLICPSFLWEEFNPDVKEVLQSCAVEAARKQLEWKEDRENRLLSKLENEYGVTVVPSMDVQVLREKSAPCDKF